MRQELMDAVGKVQRLASMRDAEQDEDLPKALLKLRVSITHMKGMIPPENDDIEKMLVFISDTLESVEHIAAMSLWENATELHRALGSALELAAQVPDGGPHKLSDPAVREAVLKITDGKCAYCGCQLQSERNGTDNFVVEHVVPKSKGGPDNIVNFVPACRGCNNAKSDRHVYHFISNVLPYRIAKAGGAS